MDFKESIFNDYQYVRLNINIIYIHITHRFRDNMESSVF